MIDFGEFLIFDGAMGTMLHRNGLDTGELPELFNLTHGEVVLSIHKAYVDAGADVITTNTFGANSHKLGGKASVREVVSAAVSIAKKSGAKYVALDVGPTGALLMPYGDMDFETVYSIFREQISAGVEAGADLIIIETMSDLLESKAAVLAAKDVCDLPVIATMSYEETGRTFIGADAAASTATLCALGADAVGINCSLGPDKIQPIVDTILEYSTKPVIVQANAGLPTMVDGKAVYDIDADKYSEYVKLMIEKGVSVIGGCCGTDPEYIRKIKALTEGKKPVERTIKHITTITSSVNTVRLDAKTAVIGERINPTGKKKLKEALRNEDYDYIIDEALDQQDSGADILDVNAGMPDIDEVKVLERLVKDIQATTPLPLQIDSSDVNAVEAAVRVYRGKPIINSVNGKEESLTSVLPIVKKYGASVVSLTLGENGIPDSADGKLAIAEKILKRALSYGIPKEDIIIDCLVMTASTNQKNVTETLKAVHGVKTKLGLKTVLGVSNISFGLPNRELVNSTFLASAFGAGLDMPILNPLSKAYMDVVSAFKVLNNEDIGAEAFISKYAEVQHTQTDSSEIGGIILSGRKNLAADAVRELLKTKTPMEIINDYIIPSLNTVGEKFEKGEFFLPQLMASAQTAKNGFDVLSENSSGAAAEKRGKLLVATVRGDIHDIGKNIVKMLLGNYGYEIIDLGRDVAPELIVKTATEQNIKLVGLSALMTTTVKNMADTIKALRESGHDCKIMVGGAVLTAEYAKLIGADYYAKDASESARIAAEVFG